MRYSEITRRDVAMNSAPSASGDVPWKAGAPTHKPSQPKLYINQQDAQNSCD